MRQIRKFVRADGGIPFDDWINILEPTSRARIRAYIDRVAMGGARHNVKRLKNAEGLLEIVIDTGPGYRVYCGQVGRSFLLLLTGGNKRSQGGDIEAARKYWRLYRAKTQLL